MAVRRRPVQPVSDEEEAGRRFRRLAFFLMASEPGSVAAALSKQIVEEARRLERRPFTYSERLDRLFQFLDTLEPMAARSSLNGRTLRENAEQFVYPRGRPEVTLRHGTFGPRAPGGRA